MRVSLSYRLIPLLLFALLLFGGGAPLRASEPALVLKVQGLPNDSATDPASMAEQRVVSAFRQRHPGIEIRGAEGLRVENMNSEAMTMMMIAGGIAPDIIRMNFRSSDTYIRQGIAAPLDAFLKEAASAGDDILATVPPQILPVLRKSGPDGVPQVYGLPGPLMVSSLFFNKELFRRAGLPARAPKDWEELAAFAQKIKALGPRVHGLALPAGASASFHLMNFIRSAGGDAVAEVGLDEWRATFNTPEALEAYLFYYRLVEVDQTAWRTSRALTPEELRSVGMMFRYVGDTVQLDPELWGFGPVPRGPHGDGGSEINASILAIFSGIREPQRLRAAWEYLRFITSEEANRLRIETLVELGQASQINPVALRKYGFQEALMMSQPGLEADFAQALAEGKPEPYGKNCNLIYLEMTYPLDQILLSPRIRQAWAAGDMASVREQAQAILNQAVAKTNERMIGHIPPETMQFRRRVTLALVVGIALGFAGVALYVLRAFTRSAAMVPRPVATRRSFVPWLCLLPALGLMLVWDYIPLLRGAVLALQDYQVLRPSAFVGLDNFANVLFDAGFWNSLLATAYFAGLKLTFGFAAPIALAYMLHLIPRHKLLYRTVYYLPAVISGTAVYFLWKALFDGEGVLNQALRLFGFEATRAWTQDPYLAMLSCVIPGIWATAGPGCLIYLAALKTIPEEQFEAAEIDGAGFWRKTISIVFPGLKALIIINFIGAVAAALQTSANILIMTGGGPNGATTVTALLIFTEAFTRLRFGTATAMAWILGSMLLGFTVIQLRRLSAMEFKTVR